MRRISPATLGRIRPIARIVLPPCSTCRPISSTRSVQLPRTSPSSSKHRSSIPSAAEEEDDEHERHLFEQNVFEDTDEIHPDDDSSSPSRSLQQLVTEVIHPQEYGEPLSDDLQSLRNHILTSFLPPNQSLQLATPPSSSPPKNLAPGLPFQLLNVDTIRPDPPATTPESVLALVSPFEGGNHYIQNAVTRVAADIDADIVRFDLALGIGLHGSGSPLGRAGMSAPVLPTHSNPLLHESPGRSVSPAPFPNPLGVPEDDAIEDMDEDGDHRGSAIVVTPFPGRMPLGSPMFPQAEMAPSSSVQENWVAFFEHWINQSSTEGASSTRRRIILLESIGSMSTTFDEWWPSLVEAVRRRRREEVFNEKVGGRKKAPSATSARLSRPTSIIFSSTPSLLLPHTSPSAATNKDQESAVKTLHPMLQEIADRLGGTVETKVENNETTPLWWGSEEMDVTGRKERDGRRLAALLDGPRGSSSLIPPLGAQAKTTSKSRHPILDLLSGGASSSREDAKAESVITRSIPIIPTTRNKVREMQERLQTRSLTSATLLGQAVAELGGHLVNPLLAARLVQIESRSKGKSPSASRILHLGTDSDSIMSKLAEGKIYRLSKSGWHNIARSWTDLRQLAANAMGQKLASRDVDSIALTWRDVLSTARGDHQLETELNKRIKGYLPTKTSTTHTASSSESSASEAPSDSVIAKLRKSKDLSPHEKRLMGCIVDGQKVAMTTFNDVHLPYKTIDAIRTIISLPLLFPAAFQGGVLKDHSTQGALLFGPPGTGKTLCARAVANESGARMLAIQPSDVNDKYFGEGEKLVKAVFSLARKLSPCVVFLDEVDALFGARSARGGGFGNKAHDQVLTEFMQEMDGLTSAGANKDKRVVVIGATNRPFDLDDAVLRRLPRRLLVDLPGPDDRQAILQILLRGEALGSDVDIPRLAKETDGFSGSDLKHLCVSAALAAVKDIIKVPWGESVTPKEKTASKSPFPEPPASGRAENIVVEQEKSEAREAELITLPTATMGDCDIRARVPADMEGSESGNDSKPESPSTSLETSNETISSHELCEQSGNEIIDKSQASSSDPPSDTPQNIPRIIHKKHFDIALSEIRPSSSEEGSLPDLRKWASQFGEGGTERGRKKGFGKGFGFGDAQARSDSGYGKVAQDE